MGDLRCHPKDRNGLWGDLGKGLNAKDCRDACDAAADCLYVTINEKGVCTSYKACSKTQDATAGGEGHSTWYKKLEEGEEEEEEEEEQEEEEEEEEEGGDGITY